MNKLIFLFFLLPFLGNAQTFYIQNKAINLVDLVDSPTLDSLGITPDSSDVFYDVTVRLNRSTYVPSLDTTVNVVDTLLFKYVLKSELGNTAYNSIWDAEAKFAQAEVVLFDEATIEGNLVKLNPVLVETRGKGYLQLNKDQFLPRYVGYWRLRYDGSNRDFRIKENGSIIEVQPAQGSIVPKPNGLTGTVSLFHGSRRIVLNNLVPNDATLKLSSNGGTTFVRRERNVQFTYHRQSIQDIPFVE